LLLPLLAHMAATYLPLFLVAFAKQKVACLHTISDVFVIFFGIFSFFFWLCEREKASYCRRNRNEMLLVGFRYSWRRNCLVVKKMDKRKEDSYSYDYVRLSSTSNKSQSSRFT